MCTVAGPDAASDEPTGAEPAARVDAGPPGATGPAATAAAGATGVVEPLPNAAPGVGLAYVADGATVGRLVQVESCSHSS